MRVQLGSVLIVVAAGVGMFSGTASAQDVDWATCGTTLDTCSATVSSCCTASAASLNFGGSTGDKAILIPMDRCHQRITSTGNMAEPGTGAPAWCENPSPASASGMFHAYGLLYRLMQMGVPAYWIVNPTKHASGAASYGSVGDQVYYEDDIDMWILHSSQTSANIPTGSAALTACTSAGSCTGPVSLLDDSLAVSSTYQFKEFPLRGAAFLIAGSDTDGDGISDRAEFNAFWDSYGDGSPASGKTCASGNDCYDFTAVSMYEVNTTAIAAWTNWSTSTAITGIPVAVKLNYKPPRIARVKSGGNVSNIFLQEANLGDTAAASCKQGIFVRSSGTLPYEPVVCDLDETDLYNNSLVTGNFGWAWFDGGANFSSCSRALQAIRTYVTGLPGVYTPGNVMVNDSRLPEFEECANHQLLGRYGAAYSSGAGALNIENAVNETRSAPWMMRYPTSLFAQYGDIPMDFASSSTGSWESGAAYGYNTLFTGAGSTLKRLLTREATRTATTNEVCGDNNLNGVLAGPTGAPEAGDKPHYYDTYPHNTAGGCDTARDNADVAAYARFDNDMLNGIVFYMPGNNLSTAGVRAQLRMLLNSLLATPSADFTPSTSTSYEASRSSPVVPLINSVDYIVQGTYVVQSPSGTAPQVNGDTDVDTFYFPFRLGHMRARLASAPTTVLFDAGCNATLAGFACPAGSSGIPTTRTIFTNSQGGDLRAVSGAKVAFNTSMSSTLKSLMKVGASLSDTTIDTIISRVTAGYPNGSGGYIAALGGVDRSTVAVIQASEVAAGGTSRPMMAYFGASDGMLHAVCAETNVAFGCSDEGHELWAFLPRKMLPHLRLNTQRIDGSPRVLDAYIDPDGAGTTYQTSWRTVLVFQTGMGDYTLAGREPAVYGIDITVPNAPILLWEYSESAPSTSSLGVGLTLTAGATTISGATKYMVWAQTNNLGTDGPGSVVTAIDLASGAKWRQKAFTLDPAPPPALPFNNPRVSGNDPVVRSAIPQGTVPLDLPSGTSAKITQIMFNDVYGRLWLVSPDTLVSVNGAAVPLFKQTADYFAMGPKPAVYSAGGTQYAVFTTGSYTDPSNTTWPTACCSSANGSSCDGTQPNPPRVCAQNPNLASTTIFPTQMAVAVKIDTAATSTYSVPASACDTSTVPDSTTGIDYPACATGFLFRRDLGRDQRGSTQALVVGTDIFLTTESDNINRVGYGTTGTSTGNLYQFSGVSGNQVAASTAIVFGSGAPAQANTSVAGARTVYAGGAGSFGTGSSSTAGSNVTASSATGVSRKVWLRTE